MRKRIVRNVSVAEPGRLDLDALASVEVSSEQADHPVDHAFDPRGGPGGRRWIAAEGGEQVLTLIFDAPQTVRELTLEIEETERERTQELLVRISRDSGRTFQEIVRQEYTFSPTGSTWERERWALPTDPITHLQLRFKPDKGSGDSRASLTSLVLR